MLARQPERSGLCVPVMSLLLICTASAASGFGYHFPEDPLDFDVIDRACLRPASGSDYLVVYATLHRVDGAGVAEVQFGTYDSDSIVWEHAHTWEISFNGIPLQVPAATMLDLRSDELGFYLTVVEGLRPYYSEGIGSPYLIYDLETDVFTETFFD